MSPNKIAQDSLKNYFQLQEEHGVLQQMVWPPQSPDLNIMESVWDYMKRQKKNCGNFSKMQEQPTCQVPETLCAGVPWRTAAVLKAKLLTLNIDFICCLLNFVWS